MDVEDLLRDVESSLVNTATGLSIRDSDKDGISGKVCADCEKTFPNATVMRRHLLVSHRGFKYLCEICQFQCGGHDWFKRHLRGHLNPTKTAKILSKDKLRLKCSKCDFSYKYHSSLKRHEWQVHGEKCLLKPRTEKKSTPERRFTCEICSDLFRTIYQLNSHQV